jgi:hypothetical protein
MIRVGKKSDIIFNMEVKDSQGFPIRVRDSVEFTFKFFTEDGQVQLEASYVNGKFKNIVAGKNVDQVVLEAKDVATLKKGVLRYTYYYKVLNERMADGFYDESGKGCTDIYIY